MGYFHYTGNLYPYYGDMNDFRIYDECLSKEQIKEISRGLILHYPLNSGYGNENLINGTADWSGTWIQKEGTINSDGTLSITSTVQYPKYGLIPVSSGEKYTISMDAKIDVTQTVAKTIGIVDLLNANKERATYLETKGVLTSDWQRFVFNITIPDNSNIKYLTYGGRNTYSNNNTAYFKNLKIEKGFVNLTIWSPNQADNLYSQLGYDSTTMYDTSGFGNNAEKINTPIYTSDTALYDSCINFNQSGYLKNTSLNLYANELTICFWVKIPSLISSQHFLLGSFNNWTSNGVAMWRDKGSTESEKAGYTIILKSTEESSHLSNFFIDNIPTNSWFFISLVYDGTTVKSYTNGILNKQTTYGNNGQIYNPVLYLGTSLFGNISTETDEASMSDFRIYSTALSAEDIKQLYESKVRIDKNGNVYCNQFVESSDMGNSNVDKKGILHTNSLIEIKSEEKCRIFKQDIQSNEIIEI